jgi:hypothetical protein
MKISRVNITHPYDTSAIVPFINSGTPLMDVVIEDYTIPTIREVGFTVEIIADAPVKETPVQSVAMEEPVIAPVVVQEVEFEIQEEPATAVEEELAESEENPGIIEDLSEEAEDFVAAIQSNVNEMAEEEITISDEEIRNRIMALTTVASVNEFMKEFGIEFEGKAPVRLKDMKAYLLGLLS